MSINPAAKRIFEVDATAGESFLCVDRSYSMRAAIADALLAGHSEISCEHGGRQYRVNECLSSQHDRCTTRNRAI